MLVRLPLLLRQQVRVEASKSPRPPLCVPGSSPGCAQRPGRGARACAHIREPHTQACPLVCAWPLGQPTSQSAECPVWEHWLSLLLTEFWLRGRNRKEPVSAHKAHPHRGRQAGRQPELLVGLRRIRVSCEAAAAGLWGSQGLCFLSLPGASACGGWSLWGGRSGERGQTPLVLWAVLGVLSSIQPHLGQGPLRTRERVQCFLFVVGQDY